MGERLYGQEALLDGLVPRLVGLERTRERLVRLEHPKGGPVVQVLGVQGSGKSAALDALYHGYNGRLPLARVDLAAAGFGERDLADLPDRQAPNASPVTHLLYLLSYKLGLRTHRLFNRPPKFPRLLLGLLVITASQPGDTGEADRPVDPAELRDAESRLRAVIAEDRPETKRRKELLTQWLDALIPSLPTVFAGLPGFDAMIQAALTTARDQLLKSGPAHRTLRWWGSRLTLYQGDDVQRLFTFVRDFRQPGDGRDSAEALLVAAFLDDIAHHYCLLRRINRKPRPLILLDNAHTPLGRRVIATLLSGYDVPLGSGSPPTRPVVVTTALGDGREHRPLSDVAHSSHWSPEPDGPPDRWLLRLGIHPVTTTDIRGMLGGAVQPSQLTQLTPLVKRLSGGRASSASTMCDAVARHLRSGATLRAADVLDLREPDGRDVAEHMLESLVPDEEVRDRLTLMSAALDEPAAVRLWALLRPDEDARARVAEAISYAARGRCFREPWPGANGSRPLIADRALRTLLLRRLRGGDRWDQTHKLLRAGYDPPGLDSRYPAYSTPYLHHSLALGEDHLVVRCLHHRFALEPPEEWLATVNLVCAAPRPPDGFPDPATAGLCRACQDAEGKAVHRAINRLTHTLWRLSDPLAIAPAEDDLARVAATLKTLYQHSDDGQAFLTAGSQWPQRLRDRTQAPDLPVPGGVGS
ncbi:hypothetical protein ACFOSC_22230 [Streptantibioticus rubrisoli]|uniref:ATP-binding protein n=1 Tax=Streptantibioticus rubrisoli TaxID=1387313 RepID=A0ABT1P8U4_9ACTN|nr:hypothetical protein [Streptantibioticus rubrisoli]MCQ4040678.1 hypothetical protein [Streptantibioticus rubrisoli]